MNTATAARPHAFRALESALLHRLDPRVRLDDLGRQKAGTTLVGAGRDLLALNGIETRGKTAGEVLGLMMNVRSQGGADFPSLLANVANKRLSDAYAGAPRTYRLWARRAPDLQDFRPVNVVQLSAAPELLQVNEHGEIRYGTMTDSGETYALTTFGRIVSLTRQAIVNDDLRAFDRLISAFAGAAARLENRTVYAQLTANPNMADGVPLFHTSRGNLGTGSGSALQASALAAGRAAMRAQKGLQGEVLNIAPAFLIVPGELEQTAYQLTSHNYVPAKPGDVNEFRAGGRTSLEPVVEPLLSGLSASAWYLAAAPGACDTVEYAYLAGAEGPRIESRTSFATDAVEMKCSLDFAAKAVDYRGLYRGDGA
ncbi:Mu-like prophage major head subunit gpT family protein [Quisquiliibacterium transsilvanicum]|uniref:Bacteriophage Mu GpT domain-containing protein n=1 Tax=Quisquiliibacterium transsilvanicum TaxID=1549638 RepID=A0A7W8M7U2_9BURK|nr:Mu-like prophage major head subunit gpT family protein [Quisquiliibacterium transsilvanicum]MBB5270314.1 hypothetical protein [Quisquiliibacterium transsilvanicum]